MRVQRILHAAVVALAACASPSSKTVGLPVGATKPVAAPVHARLDAPPPLPAVSAPLAVSSATVLGAQDGPAHLLDEPARLSRALHAVFPRRLLTLAQCPRGPEPMTWNQVDDIQRQNVARGRFVPVLVSESPGDAPNEVVAVFRVDNCQTNTQLHFVTVSLDRRALALGRARLVLHREETHPLTGEGE